MFNIFMKHTSYIQKPVGFTLIELIVAITLFSIVMVSVFSIFIFASDLSGRIEINRLMQENTKNVVETITEDIRVAWVQWVSHDMSQPWCTTVSKWETDTGDKLCTFSSEYFLWKYDDVLEQWIRVNPKNQCIQVSDNCSIVRKKWGKKFPLTNSFVAFRDIEFYVSWGEVPKVTIRFHAQPAAKKWVKTHLIQENELYFQTTISDRIIELQ